jgi:hypothetical protein
MPATMHARARSCMHRLVHACRQLLAEWLADAPLPASPRIRKLAYASLLDPCWVFSPAQPKCLDTRLRIYIYIYYAEPVVIVPMYYYDGIRRHDGFYNIIMVINIYI